MIKLITIFIYNYRFNNSVTLIVQSIDCWPHTYFCHELANLITFNVVLFY